jgi:N-acetylneuraminic acid mutarotase
LVKLSRRVILVFAVILLLLVAVEFYLQYSSSQSTGPWAATTTYPLQISGTGGVLGQSCVTANSSVYCIGGENADSEPNDTVYSAPISSAGIGNWTSQLHQYPTDLMFGSCVSSSGYVYCVGGTTTAADNDTSKTYFAPITSGAIGNWTATSPYPVPADSASCVPSSGYIFCVGGENETTGSSASANYSSSVWYASLSSSGIGIWAQTTSYPGDSFFPACSALGGYVYCVGGQDSSQDVLSTAYYASVSPNGLGTWTQTTSYPIQVTAQSCTTASTLMYCVGGIITGGTTTSNVYYAGLTPSGIGSWQQAVSYPAGLVHQPGLLHRRIRPEFGPDRPHVLCADSRERDLFLGLMRLGFRLFFLFQLQL